MVQRSFLKWAGGKSRSAIALAALAPRSFDTYIEPFVGSAAVFFAVDPERAILADANEELITCLRQVARAPEQIMADLAGWPNTLDYFLEVRAQDAEELDLNRRAARVIYLNKTAFRGLWRVNQRGQFNTPYGRYSRPYFNRGTIVSCSAALQRADIRSGDFRETLLKATAADWVYVDPPYVPDRVWGDFTRYTPGRFTAADQADLAVLLRQLDRDGVKWLLTNSDTPLVRELYSGFLMTNMSTRRDITLQSQDRSSTDLVIANYQPPTERQVFVREP